MLKLYDQNKATLADIIRVLQDREFREFCLKNVLNSEVKNFFEKEFKNYTQKADLLPTYNKLGWILSYPMVKRILVSNTEQIYLRKIMDEQKNLLVNISKGSLGSDASNILGSLLVTSIASFCIVA